MEPKENGETLQGCLVFTIVRVTQSRQIPSPGHCYQFEEENPWPDPLLCTTQPGTTVHSAIGLPAKLLCFLSDPFVKNLSGLGFNF